MPELVPKVVLDLVARGEARRQWPALALFVDVAGFTTMSERLADCGREGAELLAAELHDCFDPLLALVAGAGGQVTGFAGDAFTVLFDDDGSDRAARVALGAAAAMRDLFAGRPTRDTPAGSFTLALKLGLCAGEVRCTVVRGAGGRHIGYFHGDAIDRSAAAEHRASGGEVVVAAEVAARVSGWSLGPELPGGYRVLATPPAASGPVRRVEPAAGRRGEALFLPRAALGFPADGELRDVTAVFLSFDARDDAGCEALVARLIAELQRAGDGALRVEFGDKGGVAWTFFGAPVAYTDQSDRALAFARAAVSEPGVRAGVGQGEAYAGFLGGQARAEFTCLGRPVNLAARLMARASWGEVWCAASLRQQARGHGFESRGRHAIKGFAAPVEALAVRDATAAEASDELADEPVAESLRETVRLDRLATSVRRTVQVASVLGPVLDPAALSELLGQQPRVLDYVRLAIKAQVWHLEPDGRVRFASETLRQAAYGMLPYARRRRLQVRADEVLANLQEKTDGARSRP